MPHFPLSSKKSLLIVLLVLTVWLPSLAQRQSTGPQQKSELHLRWEGTPDVNRYRLQISRDAQFTDLIFDRAIEGREYVVKGLPLGSYYWRVAPAADETGVYSEPRTIDIPPKTQTNTNTRTGTASTSSGGRRTSRVGWAAATGEVTRPLSLRLRNQSQPDVLGVNSDGMVYALDATNGVALWTARFRPDAKRGEPTGNGGAAVFQPVAFNSADGLENVVVAYDGGVRAIEGATGRQLWRAPLPGRAASAAVGDLDGNGTMELAVFEDNPAGLAILDAGNGRLLAQARMDAQAVGGPAAFSSQMESGLLLALADGTLDVRNAKGERVRSTKLDVKFTTPPLIVPTAQKMLAMVGTDHGLVAIELATLKPLWRVATEGDPPRGQLTAADLDNDGAPDVVLITRRGRTVAVNTANGKIKWYTNLPTRAATATLTDLNGDGSTDVLIASDAGGAIGHDGRNGALIFGSDKSGTGQAPTAEGQTLQTCAYLNNSGSGATAPLVVCNDPASGGLRAEGLSSGK